MKLCFVVDVERKKLEKSRRARRVSNLSGRFTSEDG